ncbi:MAG: hypothetical protein JWQ98_430 [Chlorobi bacterium]|nr:hypothetical protein [Chlorobiota bacterium]
MKRPSIVDLSGPMLRWIRERAGWTQTRFAQALARQKKYDGDFTSVSSIIRYEMRIIVTPVLANRYREVIGPELFDQLLRMYYQDVRDRIERDRIERSKLKP